MDVSPGPLMLVVSIVLIISFFFAILVFQYKRCPSNRVLVVYGKIAGQRAARCIHGGGTFVVPLLQSYAYMSLEPMTIDIELTSALSKKNIRVNVPSTFTIGISTVPEITNNAAERLLGLDDHAVSTQARDIILGQMRLVIATLSIEEINQDREKFLDLVNKNVNFELNKIGLEMINVNIRDITDESGYIEALGQKAASEAVNKAKVEVADADREGAIGSATAKREMDVEVAEQDAQSVTGIKQAERDRRITVAQLESEGVAGESEAARKQEIVVAEQGALTTEGRKRRRRTSGSRSPNSKQLRSRARTNHARKWPSTTPSWLNAKPRPSVAAKSLSPKPRAMSCAQRKMRSWRVSKSSRSRSR